MQTTIDGIVLSGRVSGQDRVLTILTAEQGLLTAFANRAGAMRSRLAASTEVLCYSRFVIFSHRGRNVVNSADSNRIFFGLRQDWDKLCLASYFAQLAAELCSHGEEASGALRLLLNTLHYLEKGTRDAFLLKAVFELRLLTLTGFMPDLVGCGDCGAFESGEMRFFPLQGELACAECLAKQPRPEGIKVSPGVLAAMRHILYVPPEKLFSFALGEDSLRSLANISEDYLLAQVEKSFSALEIYGGNAANNIMFNT